MMTKVVAFSDFLHIPISLRCLSVWNHHSSSQRNSCGSYHQEKGLGQDLGVISHVESKVALMNADLVPSVIQMLLLTPSYDS